MKWVTFQILEFRVRIGHILLIQYLISPHIDCLPFEMIIKRNNLRDIFDNITLFPPTPNFYFATIAKALIT